MINLPYIRYLFEQTEYSWKHKKYYFDNEVAFGITRIEVGLILLLLITTYVNYLVFIKNYCRISYREEEEQNKRKGLATLFDDPNHSKPIWDRDAKPRIKNIWTEHEVQDRPNAVKIDESSSNVELSAEEIRQLRLKQFEKNDALRKRTNLAKEKAALNSAADWN